MTSTQPSARLVWAVESLAIKSTDHLLEIGCGHGVAVSLACERLGSGTITAIDRSSTMIAQASKRNAAQVAAGRASFQAVALRDAHFGATRFDTIFAIRVGAFLRGDPAAELAAIKTHLATGGRFHLIYDPFEPPQVDGVIAAASAILTRHGFTVTTAAIHEIAGKPITAIVAENHSPTDY